MKLIFFSSVLHYLFASAINERTKYSKLIYFYWDKDLTPEFDYLDNYLFGCKKDRSKFNPNDKVFYKDVDEIIISNRYDVRQVRLCRQYLHNNDKIKVSMLEEGASIYLKNPHFRYNSYFNYLKYKLDLGSYAFPRFKFDNIYGFLISDVPGLSNNCKRVNYTSYLRYLLPNQCLYDNSTVIISQWLVKKRYISSEKMISYYKSMFCKNDNIFYKPHPWDDKTFTDALINETGFQLIKSPLPVELLLLNGRNINVYGFWSSTLFYLDNLTDLKVYSMLKDISNESSNLKYLYNKTKKLISDNNVKEV